MGRAIIDFGPGPYELSVTIEDASHMSPRKIHLANRELSKAFRANKQAELIRVQQENHKERMKIEKVRDEERAKTREAEEKEADRRQKQIELKHNDPDAYKEDLAKRSAISKVMNALETDSLQSHAGASVNPNEREEPAAGFAGSSTDAEVKAALAAKEAENQSIADKLAASGALEEDESSEVSADDDEDFVPDEEPDAVEEAKKPGKYAQMAADKAEK